MPTGEKVYTQDQEHGLSNKIDQNIRFYADVLHGTNNIDGARGKNNTHGVFEDTSVLMEID